MTGECIDALYRFFSGFNIPAWPEDNVPLRDPATGIRLEPPYITVQLIAPEWHGSAPFYARLWYRSDTYDAICRKVDEIGMAIGEGVSIPTANGAVYIAKGANFCQFQPFAGDTSLKCAYLSMILQNNTPYGVNHMSEYYKVPSETFETSSQRVSTSATVVSENSSAD